MVSALMIALSASLLGVACVRPHGHQRVNPDDSNTLGLFVAQVGASGVLYSSFNRGNANVETNNTLPDDNFRIVKFQIALKLTSLCGLKPRMLSSENPVLPKAPMTINRES